MRGFAGAVLTGGASTRMGRDKALIEVGGVAMARRVADAALAAGAARVVCIGGDASALASLGLAVVPDRYPGEGPLGAVLTAFGVLDAPIVLVLACDLPDLDAVTVRAVVAGLGDHAAAFAEADGTHPLVAAYSPLMCQDAFLRVFNSGRRAVREALAEIDAVAVTITEARPLRNVNRPSDLR